MAHCMTTDEVTAHMNIERALSNPPTPADACVAESALGVILIQDLSPKSELLS